MLVSHARISNCSKDACSVRRVILPPRGTVRDRDRHHGPAAVARRDGQAAAAHEGKTLPGSRVSAVLDGVPQGTSIAPAASPVPLPLMRLMRDTLLFFSVAFKGGFQIVKPFFTMSKRIPAGNNDTPAPSGIICR